MSELTDEEHAEIGQRLRTAKGKSNLVVGAFAASLKGKNGIVSMDEARTIFKSFGNKNLGEKFNTWLKRQEEASK